VKPEYRRMLKKIKSSSPEGERSWSVYILRCRGGSYYTGIARVSRPAAWSFSERLTEYGSGTGLTGRTPSFSLISFRKSP